MQSIFLNQEQIQALFDRDSVNRLDQRFEPRIPSFKSMSQFWNSSSELQQDDTNKTTKEDESCRHTAGSMFVISPERLEALYKIEQENLQLRQENNELLQQIAQHNKNWDRTMKRYQIQREKDVEQITKLQEQNAQMSETMKNLMESNASLIDSNNYYHEELMKSKIQISELMVLKNPKQDGSPVGKHSSQKTITYMSPVKQSRNRMMRMDSFGNNSIDKKIALIQGRGRNLGQVSLYDEMNNISVNSKVSPTKSLIQRNQSFFKKVIQKVAASSDHGSALNQTKSKTYQGDHEGSQVNL